MPCIHGLPQSNVFCQKGTYKEKLIIPSWLNNIEICGEDRDKTIITYDDHANIIQRQASQLLHSVGAYTLKIEETTSN